MGIAVTLNTALSALLAQQQAVDTVSQNISNVSTEGYSRQRVRMQAIPGSYVAGGLPTPGAGVEVISIERVRDMFVDFQLRTAGHAAGRFAARATSLQRAELALGEPGDSGLRAAMSQFWNAWRDLSNAPESAAARNVVIQAGQTFAFISGRIHSSLAALRTEADAQLRQGIGEINALTERIAVLNKSIVEISAGRGNARELRDERDLALDRISTLVDATYFEHEDGNMTVSLGGRTLVSGNTAWAIYGDRNIANNNYVDLKFVVDDSAVLVRDGEVRGLLDQRDTDLPGRIADLNALVGQIIADVNAAHAAGFGLDGVGGRNFFSGADASDIGLDGAVLADPAAVAASTAAASVPGDGGAAVAISDLQYVRNLGGGTASYDEFYEGLVSSLGAAVREAEGLSTGQGLVLNHLEQLRLSAAGVNLDEEMVNLTRYQRAYEAAARLITVADEMLDTLINRM